MTVHRLFKGDHYHHWILFLYHADTLKNEDKEREKKKTILEMRKAKNALLLKLASLLFFFGIFGAFL